MKHHRSLGLLWGWDRKAFALRCYHAAIKQDWKFLLKAAEALKPRPCKPVEDFPLHLKVQSTYEDLYHQLGWKKATKELVRQTVDPNIALRHYARAFKKAGLQDIPEGKRGPKHKLIVPKKAF